jgi:dihydrofolate reductase
MMISLDGYIAGPNDGPENPGGDGAIQLHEWIASLASWRERQGLEGGVHNQDSEIIREWFDASGAVIMGRAMYDYGEIFWGDNPPFRTPVFVLTNRPRAKVIKDGGTSFAFVTDGIESALNQAREVAGDRNVDISGGANTVQQFLKAGLIDELQLHVLPVLFGDGVRLFDNHGPDKTQLEPLRIVHGTAATHLKYRILR